MSVLPPDAGTLPASNRYVIEGCRYAALVRGIGAVAIASAAWLAAAVAAAVAGGLRARLRRTLSVGTAAFALGHSVASVALIALTARNPHPDLERAWTSFMAIATGAAAVAFGALFVALQRRRAQPTLEPSVHSSV